MADTLKYDDLVAFWWGTAEAHGTVCEFYGPKEDRQVVLTLTPEITGDVGVEPTTPGFSVGDVRRVGTR
jgi:hypothetical protein